MCILEFKKLWFFYDSLVEDICLGLKHNNVFLFNDYKPLYIGSMVSMKKIILHSAHMPGIIHKIMMH